MVYDIHLCNSYLPIYMLMGVLDGVNQEQCEVQYQAGKEVDHTTTASSI